MVGLMLRIRRAHSDDGPGIHAAHAAAILVTCRSHYAAEEVAVWAERLTPASYAEDVVQRDVFVAEDGARILGFGVLDANDREVRAVYVHPDAGRRGMGRALLHVLETTARLRGPGRLHLDSSLNAVPFYLAAGWARERATTHTLAPGRDIACVVMTKTLAELPVVVREETPADADAIRAVNEAAFGRAGEGVLVDRLRHAGALGLSLLAELDGTVAGHLALSPVTIDGACGAPLGLGPMSVLPAYQGNGIGSRLVEEGLARARERGHGAVVVLGHPGFYPRFGFVPASRFGLRYDDRVPDEVFMAAELVPGALASASGFVRYRPEFDAVSE